MDTMTLQAAIGANVRRLRTDKRLHQDHVAQKMKGEGFSKWSRVTVNDLEAGRRRVGIEEAFGLAYVLEVSPLAILRPPDDVEIEISPKVRIRSQDLGHAFNFGVGRFRHPSLEEIERLRREASDLITKAASLREYVVHNMMTAERDEAEAAEKMRAVEELELRLAADVDAAKQSDS